ncbi:MULTISPECIES: hypothetical protein [Cryobacterium]|uniref:Uncharacterized protein n=1 Tax=Cryobacterium breve TaxID=1259258 RepID=A0ABY2J0R8_9MICO|nr:MULTISPECIES: hypothetical protein [Cryobacterium]TFC94245.1 hypothetical protein E3T20_08685 [Cryobacterium sp. TmT3-12]TFC98545.1 hypothetical protein E3O65_07605 [Cryobacterium breve]
MKKILGAILIGSVVLAVAASIIVRTFEDRLTKELVAQVSRLAIPAGWNQQADTVRREQFLCVSTNPCPSISWRWEAEAGEVVTAEDLVQIAPAADVTLTVDRLCEQPANNGGRAIMCIGRGVEDGYEYQLTLSRAAPGEPLQVSLYVSPVSTP